MDNEDLESRILPKRLQIDWKNRGEITNQLEKDKVTTGYYRIHGKKKKKPKHFVPVDDSVGQITTIALCFYDGTDPHTKNSYTKLYVDLLMKLARVYGRGDKSSIQITTVTPDIETLNEIHKAIATLSSFTQPLLRIENFAHIKFESVDPEGNQLDMWIQDHFLAFQNKKRNKRFIRILENSNGYFDDNNVATSIANFFDQKQKTDFQQERVRLPFKGGNVLFVGGYALVGYDNLRIGKQSKFMQEKEFLASFSRHTGIEEKKIILLGSKEQPDTNILEEGYNWMVYPSRQPMYHLDLFITPAGIDEGSKKYRLVIGDPVCNSFPYPPILNYTKKIIEEFIEKIIATQQFTIYRNPLPLTYLDRDGKKKWFFTPYNNCLVQFVNNKRKDKNYVFLPFYGSDYSNELSGYNNSSGGDWSDLSKYDLQNQVLWESLGFKVIKLTNYLPLAELRGGLRCITKVLHRAHI